MRLPCLRPCVQQPVACSQIASDKIEENEIAERQDEFDRAARESEVPGVRFSADPDRPTLAEALQEMLHNESNLSPRDRSAYVGDWTVDGFDDVEPVDDA